MVAISQSGLLAQVSSLRLPSGHSGPVLKLSNAAPASLPSSRLLLAGASVCAASLLGKLLLHTLSVVLIIYFSSQLCCPLWFQGSPQTQQWECFLVFGNFSLFKTPFLRLRPYLFCLSFFFVFYIFSYLLLKTMGCFSGCLMSSASIQKLFCGIYSVFKCSFDEFVGEKVVSLSYSSAILGLPWFPFLKSIYGNLSSILGH